MGSLRYRQIHLDFHNSPLIYNIGENFNPEEFAKIMKQAHVNSVTFFAKCHHGMSYYRTRVGVMHPSMKKDLLELAVESLHKEGINCVAYISVGWDEYIANKHPDYIEITPEGKLSTSFLEARWKKICLNNEKYIEYLLKQTEEILENYDVDGIFYDIVFQAECTCKRCIDSMMKEGLNPERKQDRLKFKRKVEQKFMSRTFEFVQKIKPGTKVFFNSRLRIGMEEEFPYYTHFEIESLPTGGWSYNHFPIMAKYFQNQDKEFLGMTARFNLSWADFGGLKNEKQLEYEIFRMLANGGKCGIGDQMNPDGTLEKEVYHLIGKVYEKVENLENYYQRVKPYSEIAVFSLKEPEGTFFDSLEGAFRILLQSHVQFSVITGDMEFEKFKLIIFPDSVRFDEKLAKKTKNYLKNGGKIMLSHDSGLVEDGKFFIENIEFVKKSPYKPDYFQLPEELNEFKTRFVMYQPGNYVKGKNCQEIGKLWKPYFNRTWYQFSSHQQTPYEKETEYPAVLIGENFSYIWAPIFYNYINYGNQIYFKLVKYLIESMIEREICVENLPENAEVYYQKGENCFLISILYYPYQKLTKNIDVVLSEGIAKNVRIKIKTDKKLKRILKVPSEENIEFSQYKYTEFLIDEISGFCTIFGEYE